MTLMGPADAGEAVEPRRALDPERLIPPLTVISLRGLVREVMLWDRSRPPRCLELWRQPFSSGQRRVDLRPGRSGESLCSWAQIGLRLGTWSAKTVAFWSLQVLKGV